MTAHCSADALFFLKLSAWWLGEVVVGGVGVSEWPGRVRGCHNRVTSLWDDSPSFAFCLISQLESPQIVLLCAGAFPQGDVVHSHLATSASPALPLQDHLVNSSKAHILSTCYIPSYKRECTNSNISIDKQWLITYLHFHKKWNPCYWCCRFAPLISFAGSSLFKNTFEL